MNSPNVSPAESRRPHAGSFRFAKFCAIAAATVVATSVAMAATPAPNVPHTHADTPGGSVSPEVAAAKKKVADLELKLRQLQEQMRQLEAQKPADPGPNATAEQQKTYHQATAKWQTQVDKVQHQIDVVTQQLAEAKKKLQALTSGQSGAAS